MTTADHRPDADQYSDRTADDRRFDQDGTGYDADRPAGGYGEAHDAPATQDESHLDDGVGEHGHVQRLDTQDGDAHLAGQADASGAHPVDVDPASSTTTESSVDHSVDHTTDSSVDNSVDNTVDSPVDRSTDYPAEHAAAAGDGTPAVSGTVAAVPTTASSGTTSGTTTGSGDLERLVPANRVDEYTSRWDAVKGEFVDEPRQAVAKADKLVGELLDELDQLFRKQRSDLEHGLDADETSTEDLRLALRKYRSFFDRLLAL